ncbi:hypothetical protein MGG_17395 [Pyricularia oryzae 70-15]|uniref:Uncharacterized protein n=1 Tax=Pyricularia oryzae (strain 70-15 / ATCC MYA-4617 / FGSC 8958) TaxID=242507 RepID=G4NAZ9_PYRO7|nr:uncharacterized protein MGG_17395 [Pyricularia oryzae 70-15]EHA48761.1 hypothetical protein MGG_17395 [Pyricularia oryzae 70-15]
MLALPRSSRATFASVLEKQQATIKAANVKRERYSTRMHTKAWWRHGQRRGGLGFQLSNVTYSIWSTLRPH